MIRLQSYLAGRWQSGEGAGSTLIDPSLETPLAVASARGLSRGAALAHARDVGGPALRRLTLRQRGAALKALSAAILALRVELIDLSVATAGNTLGGALTWWMGYGAEKAYEKVTHHAADHRALRWLERFGARACLLAWLPIVGDPLCAVAGWLRLPFWPCVGYMAIGKFARYVTMTAGLLWLPGMFTP